MDAGRRRLRRARIASSRHSERGDKRIVGGHEQEVDAASIPTHIDRRCVRHAGAPPAGAVDRVMRRPFVTRLERIKGLPPAQ